MEDVQRRRRIDRVTSDDYLHELGERSVSQLRSMRDECREEEEQLSYARRLVQGRLDVVRAALQRREHGENDPLDLVALLPSILADEPATGQREARNVSLYTPQGPRGQRAHDALFEDPVLSRIPDLDAPALRDLVERLAEQERAVSVTRRKVLDHYDRLQAELIERYRQGAVGEVVSAVVAEETGAEGPGEE